MTQLRIREMRPSDIDECLKLLGQYRFTYDDETWEALPQFLVFLFSKTLVSARVIIEDSVEGSSIVGFNVAGFVKPSFFQEAAISGPGLGRKLVRSYFEDELPILTPRAISEANQTDGLYAIHVCGAMDVAGSSNEKISAILYQAADSFYQAFAGYRLLAFLSEAYGIEFHKWCLSAGYRTVTDYSEYYQAEGMSAPPETNRPYLIVLESDDAAAKIGSNAQRAFHFRPSRFRFRTREIEMLRMALDGHTDEKLAKELCVTPWTIKKRWRHVYARARETGLIPRWPIDNEDPVSQRGAERRRHLVAHLREHPEELCPVHLHSGKGRSRLNDTVRVTS